MRGLKLPVIAAVCLSLTMTTLTPITPAYAASISDLLPQLTSTDTSSSGGGHGIMDILMGLLLGKLLGSTNFGSLGSSLTSPSTANTAAAPASSSNTSAIIATAQKYMGVPYVWGGETPSGFDCSGFVQYVMKQNGITLPRTAEEQFAVGTSVDRSNLKVGDVVFFTTYKPGASHEGIYLGNDQFIHASSAAAKVTVSSLSEQFYTDHYIGARRYQ